MDIPQTVYIVDDDPYVSDSLRELLESGGFQARSFYSGRQFLDDAGAKHGCLIADIDMPHMGGLDLQEETIRRKMDLAVIIMTGDGDPALVLRALQAGAIDVLDKPFSSEALFAGVTRALRAGSLVIEADAARLLAALTAANPGDPVASPRARH